MTRATASRACKRESRLTYAALCMAKQVRHLRLTTRRLVSELERQILPDGGHISRNPGSLSKFSSICCLSAKPLRPATCPRRRR